MTTRVYSLANPALLVWARETSGLDLESAAKRFGKAIEELIAWEKGEKRLTVPQLRTAARIYRRPLAVFFLPEPPKDFDVLRDFRRLPKGVSPSFSPQLRYLIRDVAQRQEWASEFRMIHGQKPLKYVGSQVVGDNILEVASNARQLLSVTLEKQTSWRDPKLAFRFWVDACEENGLLVFQSSDVMQEEMRGFAVPDKYAPTILINAKDTQAARIFTLLHEYVHILIAAPGISNLNLPRKVRSQDERTEVFCNAVAAEILVPRRDFKNKLVRIKALSVDDVIVRASQHYAVSRDVIARRLLDLKYISQDQYEARHMEYIRDAEASRASKRGRPMPIPWAKKVIRANGRHFAREVLSAYSDGEISARDVSSLLNSKLKHFPRIESEIFPSRWQGVEVE